MKRYYIYVTWTESTILVDESQQYSQNCFVDLDLKTMTNHQVIDKVFHILKNTNDPLRGTVRIEMMVKA